jgi:diadenosine tetraphosphate (Ap4A) HIT family hydrolase
MDFILDAQLANDSFFIKDLELTQVRLINNANYLWVILVPRINNIKEILDLSYQQYTMLNQEIFFVATVMQKLFKPDKLNIATIGNKVSQLHYHIVVRYINDQSFPSPVWGQEAINYSLHLANDIIEKINFQLTQG